MTLKDFQKFNKKIDQGIVKYIDIKKGEATRKNNGLTQTKVAQAIKKAEKFVKK